MRQRRILLVLAVLGVISSVLAFAVQYPSYRRGLQRVPEAERSGETTGKLDPASDVEIDGTVDRIEQVSDGLRPWKVRVRVGRVLLGDYPHPVLEFLVHSPTQSGLAQGQRCVVRATRTASGYSVRDPQWMSPSPALTAPDAG